MKTLRSYVAGRWHEADGGFVELVNPPTEETVARASSRGIDFGSASSMRAGEVVRRCAR
jgi:hypothetical protein